MFPRIGKQELKKCKKHIRKNMAIKKAIVEALIV